MHFFYFISMQFSFFLLIGIFRFSYDNALRWMQQELTGDKSTLVQVMAWCCQCLSGSKPLPEPVLAQFSVPNGATRPQWQKTDRVTTTHYGTVTQYGDIDLSASTLAQVMACCLTAPSHYLSQCWLIICEVQWHSSEGSVTRNTTATNKYSNWLI